MQIFIPYTNIQECVQELDNKRLNKQITECTQILKASSGLYANAWVNHPVVRMYWPYREFVRFYRELAWEEFVQMRGFSYQKTWSPLSIDDRLVHPHWWGVQAIHESHRSALFRKDPQHYVTFIDCSGKYESYVYPQFQAPIASLSYSPRFDDRRFWYLGLYVNLPDTSPYELSPMGQRYAEVALEAIADLENDEL